MGLLDLDGSPGLQLAARIEEELCDLGAPAEFAFETRERAPAIPERALLAGTALCVALGDELDRAEWTVLLRRLHVQNMPR